MTDRSLDLSLVSEILSRFDELPRDDATGPWGAQSRWLGVHSVGQTAAHLLGRKGFPLTGASVSGAPNSAWEARPLRGLADSDAIGAPSLHPAEEGKGPFGAEDVGGLYAPSIGSRVALRLALLGDERQGIFASGPRIPPPLGELLVDPFDERWLTATVSGKSVFVVAPYLYAPDDLDRLAWHIALEVGRPCAQSVHGVTLLVGSGWAQKNLLLERVEVHLATRDTTGPHEMARGGLSVEQVEGESAEVLSAATLWVKKYRAIAVSAFVYPLRLEDAEVLLAVERLGRETPLFVLNHRPSLAWRLGVGPTAMLGRSRVSIAAHPLMHPALDERVRARQIFEGRSHPETGADRSGLAHLAPYRLVKAPRWRRRFARSPRRGASYALLEASSEGDSRPSPR